VEFGQHVPAAVWTPQSIDSSESAIHIAELEVRPDSREVLGGDGRIQLTGRELDVLMTLIEQPDRVVTRDAIYAKVWGGDMPYRDRAVDVYVRRVREKLRILTPEQSYIHTHFGIGYRFWRQPANSD
jgi:DNA-binding response OmpR family regulator